MKSKIFKNLGLKILALFFAVILWLVVMNVSDYAVTNKINEIPVIQLNGDALEELDQIYDVTKGNTVDIIVKGRRSVVDGLSADDFEATADLSTMSITNTVQIFVTPKNKSLEDDITITYVDNTMSLALEDKLSVQFPVSVKTLGTVKENYAITVSTPAPNLITVEGPKTAVSKITRAEVEIKVDEREESFMVNSEINLYDAYDEKIQNDKIKVSDSVISVKTEIYPIKEIAVEVELEGEPAEGYLVSEVMYQPHSILVVGDPELLSDIKKIKVDGVSLENTRKNYETTLDITDYLPEGVYLAQPNKDIAVTVEIERASTKNIVPLPSNFTILNDNKEYVYKISLSDDFAVTVSGLEEDIKNMTAADLRLKIDCTELYYGMYNDVEYEFYEKNGVTYQAAGTVDVRVMTAEEAEREKEGDNQ